jgi:hypothetical protein
VFCIISITRQYNLNIITYDITDMRTLMIILEILAEEGGEDLYTIKWDYCVRESI